MYALVRKCIASKLTPSRHKSLQALLYSSSNEITADFLTTQHNLSPETALKVSQSISHPDRADSVLRYLKQAGFSAPQIDLMLNKRPRILNARPEKLKEKLDLFQGKGFSAPDAIDIISRNPRVLHRSSENRLGPSVDALKAALGSTEAACIVLKRHFRFLETDLNKTMVPNMEYLKERCELSSGEITAYFAWFPRLFLLRPESVAEGARKVDEMGLPWSRKMYLHAIRVVCLLSNENFESKIRLFRGLGFSDVEVMRIFNRCPVIFCSSEKTIKETVEELLRYGRGDASIVVKNTELLGYSLEKRIKPRLRVLEILEKRGLLSPEKPPALTSILYYTNQRFFQNYVLCNSEALGHDCVVGITKTLDGK